MVKKSRVFGRAACVAAMTMWCAVSGTASGQVESAQRSERSSTFVPDRFDGGQGVDTDTTPPRVASVARPIDGKYVAPGGLGQLSIEFTEPVQIPISSIEVRTSAGQMGFTSEFDASSRLLTIVFDSAIRADRVTVVLSYSITDDSGNALDGELDPDQPLFPSGDGVAGGEAVLRFDVLEGDADRNGVVDENDANIILAAMGTQIGDEFYDPDADLNDDGVVNVQDVAAFTAGEGSELPQGDGQFPTIVGVTPDPGDALTSEIEQVGVTFSEQIDVASLRPSRVFAVDSNGAPRAASSVQAATDGLSATFEFSPPLEPCDRFDLSVSRAISDSSGELLSDAEPFVFDGNVPNAPPVLDPFSPLVSSSTITLSGEAPSSSVVEISGPDGLIEADVVAGEFLVEVPLLPNTDNPLYATAISFCGVRSAPVLVNITQDMSGPFVFIDQPAEGAEIQADTTDVAGRVGDILSGFDGLQVLVNGVEAEVDIGIGTNGTFFLPGVPLNENGDTSISVQAFDTLGNASATQITVSKLAIPEDAVRFQVASGNGQTASVDTQLSEPIVVRVVRSDGVTPFSNKIVTFSTLRSNGRLSAEPGELGGPVFQARTDPDGFAEAYWTLGSDAGCGNNRVGVTSQDIAGTVVFCASATPGPAAQINVGLGNRQRVEVGASAPEPLSVWVSDSCNGVAGELVAFYIAEGDGLLNGAPTAIATTSDTGHASVLFTAGNEGGQCTVRAVMQSDSEQVAEFEIQCIERDQLGVTSFEGIVVDNASQPIEGAFVELIVAGQSVGVTMSDSQGAFNIIDIPIDGPALLHVDGVSATAVGGVPIPAGTFPALEFIACVVEGVENSIGGPVLLPELNPTNNVVFDGTQDVELTIEGIEGLRMFVPAGTTIRKPDGSIVSPANPVALSLNQVHFDDIPMPMPDGAAPPFAWTLQPGGATFDPPLRVEYPNMSGLPAGSIAYFLQFIHETGKFDIVASATVSEDGSSVFSDPGSGIPIAGWGCNCPPYSVTGDCCEESEECTETGSLEGGELTVNDDPAIGDQIQWSLSDVTDTGGQRTVECPGGIEGSKTESISAGGIDYSWTITAPDGSTTTGSGTSASITASSCGAYSCTFVASVDRDCAPPPQRFSKSANVAFGPYEIEPTSSTIKIPVALVQRFTDLVNKIPRVRLEFEGKTVNGSFQSGFRDCCDPVTGQGQPLGDRFIEGQASAGAAASVLLTPGLQVDETFSYAGTTWKVAINAGVFFNANLQAVGSVGRRTNLCVPGDQTCTYGQLTLQSVVALQPELSIEICYDIFGVVEACDQPFSATATASVRIFGTGRYNSKTACDGLNFEGSIGEIKLAYQIIIGNQPIWSGEYVVWEGFGG